jgi:hypothetical protein
MKTYITKSEAMNPLLSILEVNYMRIVTEINSDDLEIRKMYIDNSFTIIVEIFTVPEGYKSFARNSFLHHGDLLGSGFHENKEESINLAIKDLRELMEEFPG